MTKIEEYRVRIYRYLNPTHLLEISEEFSPIPSENTVRIELVALEPESQVPVAKVTYFAGVDDFKLVCHDIIDRNFCEWRDDRMDLSGEESGTCRVISILRDFKYRVPYLLKIDNGAGALSPGGKPKMALVTGSLTLSLQERDARLMAMTVLDWIRDWEVTRFRKRREARTTQVTWKEDPTER